jgi:hypothetical protein
MDEALVKNGLVEILNKVDHYNFPIFEYSKKADGEDLVIMGYQLLSNLDLYSQMPMSPSKFKRFLKVIQKGYFDNPYHNKTHATDVAQTVYVFLTFGQFSDTG